MHKIIVMLLRCFLLIGGLFLFVSTASTQTHVCVTSCPWISVSYVDGSNGIPVEQISFTTPPDGTYMVYSDATESQLLMEGEIAAGKKQGQWRYYTNNQLCEVITYHNDIREGLYELYDANGIMRLRTTFTNNQANGLYETWDAAGNLVLQKHAVDGIIID